MNYLSDTECLRIASEIIDSKVISKGKTKEGVSSYVLEIESQNGQIYFFKQGNNNYLLQQELEIVLKKQGLSTPEIIYATPNYMIVKGVMGEAETEVVDRKTKIDIAEKFGEYLSILHKNKTTGWGPLVDINTGKFSSFYDFYLPLLSDVDPNILDIVKNVLVNTNNSCLNHGDTGATHIFTNREESFWGLIDYDDILSAPNLYDLAEFHNSLDGDTEIWDKAMQGYSKNAEPVNTNSHEFLVNEYLICLDSVNWYMKENRPELQKDLERDARKVKLLIEKIKKLI
jgi:hypothetical protein